MRKDEPARIKKSALEQQLYLLKLEHDYEQKEYALRSERTGLEWKIKRGICWFPVNIGRTYYNSINQLVADVFRNKKEEDGEAGETDENTEMEHAKPVCFFTRSASGEIKMTQVEGAINYVENDRMVVALKNEGDINRLKTSELLGVQLYFDESIYQLMQQAVLRTMTAKEGRLAELRDLLTGTQVPRFANNQPIPFPWLNSSQEAAVNKVLNTKDVAIVHGPPGTGKTTTLVEAIYETLRREPQVMVCAQSNMAVDWISDQLSQRGLNVLRIGNPTRVTDQMLANTYERRFESHPLYDGLWSIRQALRNLYGQLRNSSGNKKSLHEKISQLKEQAIGIEINIKEDLFNQARVIACTLTGAANRELDRMHFGSLFIDEAAQALEAACWIAIGKADRVIFAGDHCQLPPTIKSVEAARAGLGKTLMEKVAENKPECVSLLTTQYRMNEAIVKFPSYWFYHGRLKSAPMVQHRNILEYDTPMEWYDTGELDFKEKTTDDGTGRRNEEEAQLCIDLAIGLLLKIGIGRIREENIDFGILSPYKNQISTLRRIFKQKGLPKSARSAITINTIDGFQGQERDVIIISLVRSNADGNIGFLNELRRMNVAITRAKMKLIIVGNADTLCHHPFYKKFYEYTAQEGKITRLVNEADPVEPISESATETHESQSQQPQAEE